MNKPFFLYFLFDCTSYTVVTNIGSLKFGRAGKYGDFVKMVDGNRSEVLNYL